ncbi:HAD family hydrolase [Spongorhabdus nitratireducens]
MIIAFDADDTLWVNEPYFREAEAALLEMLSRYYPGEDLLDRLYQQEIKNLNIFGYGAKAFTLSMIESAIELSHGKVSGSEIQRIIDLGRGIMSQPVKLLKGVEETIKQMSSEHQLMLITKGDLFDQESKIARSGLADYFRIIEVVSEKDEATYNQLLIKHNIQPDQFWMVGNSLRSDVLPIVELGGQAVHIPCDVGWVHEHVDVDESTRQTYHELTCIDQLPELISKTA